MLNKVQLIGRLGQDPDIRHTQGGDVVANLSLATSRRWKDDKGDNLEKTEWHRCVLWRKQAEIAESYLKKGSLIYVEGRLETNKYEKDDETRYSTQIVVSQVTFLDTKKEGG